MENLFLSPAPSSRKGGLELYDLVVGFVLPDSEPTVVGSLCLPLLCLVSLALPVGLCCWGCMSPDVMAADVPLKGTRS